jgi:histidine triad (HIT) family protein
MSDCIFCKLANKEIPTDVVKEDDIAFAFNDMSPQAPTHILIIPKKHYTGVSEMHDEPELGHLITMANEIAKEKGLGSGYRLIINNGLDGGQSVFHTHVHLLGGRKLGWPPG